MKRRKTRRTYRNRNRQWDTRQNTFAFTLKTTAVIVFFIFGIVSWLVAKHSCESIEKEIAREENRSRQLSAELIRETARWNDLKTPRRLSETLLSHGIVGMSVPSPSRCVAMNGRAPARPGAAPAYYASNR